MHDIAILVDGGFFIKRLQSLGHPLRYTISKMLFEHVDGLRHGLNKAGEPQPGDDGELVENIKTEE